MEKLTDDQWMEKMRLLGRITVTAHAFMFVALAIAVPDIVATPECPEWLKQEAADFVERIKLWLPEYLAGALEE